MIDRTASQLLSANGVVLSGVALFILVGGAGWALYIGLWARHGARAAAALNRRLEALLGSAPALAMIVRADGRLECPGRLAGWFGFDAAPSYLDALAGTANGLTSADAAALAADVVAAQKAGRSFTRAVTVIGSSRTLTIRGRAAPRGLKAPGGVVLWVFDATDSEAAIARLSAERDEAHEAFDALAGVVEAAPLPMWYRGADLRLAMVNSAYVEAVDGRDHQDVIGRGVELVEGSGLGGPLAGAVAARDEGVQQMQTMPATIGGMRRMLRVFDVPMPGGGVAGFAVDIEDLEQARSWRKRFGETQRAMLDRLSAGVVQFDADRTLTFSNLPFRRMFAMRGEWLTDRPEFDRVLERMRDANRLPEVRDFPGWKAERRDWFLAAEGAIEENWHLPGGTHLRVVGHPLPDGGLLLIVEDRTEQVQLASARDTLLRVRTATFENLFEALGVFAADGRLQLWNNKFRLLWGFSEEFLATHPRVDALAEAAASQLANPGRSALIGALVRAATIERQQRGGRVAFANGRHYEFAAVPLPDGNGLFTMLDISDSRRIERALRDRNDALEAADRVKTAFVANMSYELRTPLTSISGFAEMLGEGYAGALSEQATGFVAAITESAGRLGVLIDEVLDLTRDDADPPRLDRVSVDLAAEVADAAKAMTTLIERRALDFAVEIGDVGMIRGDPARLRQIVEHLLRHAVAGTPAKGRILLHADSTSEAARIIVSDNGPGLKPQAVARAFDRFAQPGVTQSGERALGLGLPLARQFVEAHGGTIEMISEPGQGTMIIVTLPR